MNKAPGHIPKLTPEEALYRLRIILWFRDEKRQLVGEIFEELELECNHRQAIKKRECAQCLQEYKAVLLKRKF